MKIKLQKNGEKSCDLLETFNLRTNDKVDLNYEDNKIVITKPKKKISLEEKFKEYNGENLAEYFSWDSEKGKEIW